MRALAVVVALAACGGGPDARTDRKEAEAPRVILETRTGAHAVTVEVARTDAARAYGLMNRTFLAPDAGMLFVFEASEVQSFWMKNTLIPLDMIFIGEDARVVGVIERAEPLTLTQRSIGKPSRYVLEVNGGWSAAHDVRAGDRVKFERVF